MQITPANPSRLRRFAELCLLITVMLGVSSLLGIQTRENIPIWYDGLIKPPLQPPPIAFPVVWTLLYIALAVVAWRLIGIWHRTGTPPKALKVFAVNIVLNWAWTPVFFGAHLLLPAAILLLAIWATAFWLLILLWQQDRAGFWLTLPYQIWLSFAGYLAWGIYLLN